MSPEDGDPPALSSTLGDTHLLECAVLCRETELRWILLSGSSCCCVQLYFISLAFSIPTRSGKQWSESRQFQLCPGWFRKLETVSTELAAGVSSEDGKPVPVHTAHHCREGRSRRGHLLYPSVEQAGSEKPCSKFVVPSPACSIAPSAPTC